MKLDEKATLKTIGMTAGQFDAYMRGMKVGDFLTGGFLIARANYDMMLLWCRRNNRKWRFDVTFPGLPRVERVK